MPRMRRSLRTVSVGWAPRASQLRARSSSITIVEGSVWALYWPIVSITRPSRGERWSATTTRHIGCFLPPTRVSLSLTATSSSRPGAWTVRTESLDGARREGRQALAGVAHQRADVRHRAAPDPAHHPPCLLELLDQTIHVLDAHPGAAGDAQPARALDQLRPAAL